MRFRLSFCPGEGGRRARGHCCLESAPEQIARQITDCAGILLPGSKADVDPQKFNAEKDPMTARPDPPRDAADELLLQDAYNLRKPVLGICYGLQALNVWRSGTLVQHMTSGSTTRLVAKLRSHIR